MTYRGEVKRWRAPLGIKPTPEDHNRVRALSLMGMGVREICAKMGEHFALDRPLSRLTLYHHFREDLQSHKRGPRGRPPASDVATEIQSMIVNAEKRRGLKK